MAKGAGMLAPALATMLCVLTTDADLTRGRARLARCARRSRMTFDRLDTDGCMSTNDTVLLLASGASGVRPDKRRVRRTLTEVCADLARQLQLDAEGAQKMITIEVIGAAGENDAVTVGRAVARNNLLKCAITGEDPNWGRILAAVGHHRRDLRAGPAERRGQRRLGVPPRRGRRGTLQGGPDPRRTSRSPWTSPPARHSARHLDHRPDRRLRPRELGLLHMTVPAGTART